MEATNNALIIVSILLKYLTIILQNLAFGFAYPQIVGSIPATGESVFFNIFLKKNARVFE